MPKSFDNCVKAGGRVRTIHVAGKRTECLKVCYKNGKSHAGHTFHCKPGPKTAKHTASKKH